MLPNSESIGKTEKGLSAAILGLSARDRNNKEGTAETPLHFVADDELRSLKPTKSAGTRVCWAG
jgi:hypothetical protein